LESLAQVKPDIRIKRIYESHAKNDGSRVLVDRIWPRGISKEIAALALWLKDIAPMTNLRKWFNHAPARWAEFCPRYHAELEANPAPVEHLWRLMETWRVTLLYAAHDTEHNQAVALAEYLFVHR
jgi:uncharacterized protein YeaO (DUF488 family)